MKLKYKKKQGFPAGPYFKRKYNGANRPCRHVISKRIYDPKICIHNYECYNCAFDQLLDIEEEFNVRK